MVFNKSVVFICARIGFMTIYVGNLSLEVVEEDLEELFSAYGLVKHVDIPTDRETGKNRGFAFVEMGTPDEEASAIGSLDGAEFKGRQLRVNQSRPRDSNDRRSSSFRRPR
jgi:RNA recognition motif-containing protein